VSRHGTDARRPDASSPELKMISDIETIVFCVVAIFLSSLSSSRILSFSISVGAT
jgi:hypothetical protein